MSCNIFPTPADPSTDIDRPALAWIWKLPPAALLDVLSGSGLATSDGMPRYWLELRKLTLHLIIETPLGPPADATAFIQRCDSDHLAKLWGGSGNDLWAQWRGEPGVDRLIRAVTGGEQPMLSVVAAEAHNMFRSWARHPSQAREAVRVILAGLPGEHDAATLLNDGDL
ncbi:hypothetical protein GZH49_38155 [Nocardia terpenica]|uniref:hypothetical protein n=1 Tax=Nocardia terpenica TaxID=455432 RepID=UPI002FE0F8C0